MMRKHFKKATNLTLFFLQYMKSVMYQCKAEHEGSVIAEVGSEHSIALPANSDGHITDSEEAGEPVDRERNKNSEIQVLKDCLLRQG